MYIYGSYRKIKTRAVLSPGNRAKPCNFRYVKSVRNFIIIIIIIIRIRIIFITGTDKLQLQLQYT